MLLTALLMAMLVMPVSAQEDAAVSVSSHSALTTALADPNGAVGNPQKYIKLTGTVTGDVTIAGNLYLDLNGNDINGIVTITGGELYLFDSATGGYSAATYGKVTDIRENGGELVRSLVTPQALGVRQLRYVTIRHNEMVEGAGGFTGYSAHRIYIGVSHSILIPAIEAVDYRTIYLMDEVLQKYVVAYGGIVTVNQVDSNTRVGNEHYLPVSSKIAAYSSSNEESVRQNWRRIQVRNILGDNPEYNATQLASTCCAYIQLADGTEVRSSQVSKTFQQAAQAAQAQAATGQLSEKQNMLLTNMYLKHQELFETWNAGSSEGSFPVKCVCGAATSAQQTDSVTHSQGCDKVIYVWQPLRSIFGMKSRVSLWNLSVTAAIPEASFNMYGGRMDAGSITSSNVGAIYMQNSSKAKINIFGGTVVGCKQATKGCAFYLDNNAVMTVSGNAQILGGHATGWGGVISTEKGTKLKVMDNASITGGTSNDVTAGDVQIIDAVMEMSGGHVGVMNVRSDSAKAVLRVSGTAKVDLFTRSTAGKFPQPRIHINAPMKPGASIKMKGITGSFTEITVRGNRHYFTCLDGYHVGFEDDSYTLNAGGATVTHCVCGAATTASQTVKHNPDCDKVIYSWVPFNEQSVVSGGNYYLTGNLTRSAGNPLVLSGITRLDLNGWNITGTAGSVIKTIESADLLLSNTDSNLYYGSEDGGVVATTGGSTNQVYGTVHHEGGVLTVMDGVTVKNTVSGDKGSALYVSGTAEILGGKLIGGKINGNGSAVVVTGTGGNINPHGSNGCNDSTSYSKEDYVKWGQGLAAIAKSLTYIPIQNFSTQVEAVAMNATYNMMAEFDANGYTAYQRYLQAKNVIATGIIGPGIPQSYKDTYKIYSSYHADRIIKRYEGVNLVMEKNGGVPVTAQLPIAAFRVGNIGYVVAPYEMFDTNGVQIKEASPYDITIITTMSNGCQGYIPNIEGFVNGGYSTDVSPFDVGTGELMVEYYLRMLDSMKDK